jgi:hypothetical protein
VELLTVAIRRAAIALAAAWLATAPLAAQRTPEAATEDDIKAAFLFNFTRFVEWPAADTSSPFVICTEAAPGFAAAVDRIVAGESIRGRALKRVTPADPGEARGCQMLFIGRAQSGHADRWISAVRGLPVLVVSESDGAWSHGSQINFVIVDQRVKFDVNVEAAAESRLAISSKLLRVARNVKGGRAP